MKPTAYFNLEEIKSDLFHRLAVKHLEVDVLEMPFVNERLFKFVDGFVRPFFFEKTDRRYKIRHLEQAIEFGFDVVVENAGERRVSKSEVQDRRKIVLSLIVVDDRSVKTCKEGLMVIKILPKIPEDAPLQGKVILELLFPVLKGSPFDRKGGREYENGLEQFFPILRLIVLERLFPP